MYEITKFNPCKEALKFRANYPDFKSAWKACPRGDWMLWIAQKVEVDLLILTTAKATCANTVRHLMKDKRSKTAIKVALAFGKGKAGRVELDKAADAASAAYAADAAAYAAYAAAYAAYAASAAAYAAYAADADATAYASAAASAADAADADVADVAKKENQLKTANICRRILTKEVFKKLNIK